MTDKNTLWRCDCGDYGHGIIVDTIDFCGDGSFPLDVIFVTEIRPYTFTQRIRLALKLLLYGQVEFSETIISNGAFCNTGGFADMISEIRDEIRNAQAPEAAE